MASYPVRQRICHQPFRRVIVRSRRGGFRCVERDPAEREAGHRSLQTTLQSIHLSGRDLSAKIERGMAEIHARRMALTVEILG